MGKLVVYVQTPFCLRSIEGWFSNKSHNVNENNEKWKGNGFHFFTLDLWREIVVLLFGFSINGQTFRKYFYYSYERN